MKKKHIYFPNRKFIIYNIEMKTKNILYKDEKIYKLNAGGMALVYFIYFFFF